MGGNGVSFLLQFIRRIAASTPGDVADEQLLTRFADSHDEKAFAGIVLRHGPLVLRVCQQVLRDPHDVEDAFQATFLVLVRRAGSIRKPERLAGWLYGVASRVATRVRVRIARRRSHEKPERGLEDKAAFSASVTPDDWYLLHEEVNRLPEKFRLPIVLCYFQGMTREQAACQLGWTEGAIKGSLERGREMLRSRLLRHGSLLAGYLPAAAQGMELPSIPGPVLSSTVVAAARFAQATAGAIEGIPQSVLSLTKEVLTPMLSSKLIVTTATLVLLGVMLPGAWLYSQHRTPAEEGSLQAANPPVAAVPAKKVPAPAEDPVAKELKDLEGLWNFQVNDTEDKEWGGRGVPLETIRKGTLEFRGKEITWDYPSLKYKISFKLDPSKTPKQIDITFLDGKRKGKTYQGIYSVDKRKAPLPWLLELCLRDDAHAELGRPERSHFASGNEGLSLIVLSRVAEELQPFQGVWTIDLCDSANQTLYAPNWELGKWRWTVKGKEIIWARKGEEWKLSFKVDPSKSPKQFDLTYLSGPFKGATCLGMYEWRGRDGKSLHIAIQDPGAKVGRPAKLEMTGTSQNALIFLHRTEPVDPAKELALFQGMWTFDNVMTDVWPKPIGKVSDKNGQGSERRWVVKGNEITWIGLDGKEAKASFTIDPHKVPRHIDFTFLNGPHKGTKCAGVYEWVGGKELWLCLVDPGRKADRPTDLSYSTNAGRSWIFLARYLSPAAKEQGLLQGVWKFEVCESEWWPVNRPTTKAEFPKWRWTVKGNEMSWTGVSTGDVKVSFTVNPTKSPKQIDFTFLDGPHKGEKCMGVYKLKGGSLWVCVQDPGAKVIRPKDFSAGTSKGRSLLALDPVEKK